MKIGKYPTTSTDINKVRWLCKELNNNLSRWQRLLKHDFAIMINNEGNYTIIEKVSWYGFIIGLIGGFFLLMKEGCSELHQVIKQVRAFDKKYKYNKLIK